MMSASGSRLIVEHGRPSSGARVLEEASRLEALFAGHGISSGDVVGVAAARTWRSLAVLVALWRRDAMAAMVPQGASGPYLEQRLAAVGAAFLVRTSSAGVVVEQVADLAPRSPGVEALQGALCIFTSGTTGLPKAVVHSHRSILTSVEVLGALWELGPSDVLVHGLPLHHVHGLIVGLLGVIGRGGSVAFVEHLDAERITDAAGTVLFAVPTTYYRLARRGALGVLAPHRLVVSGSAPLQPALAQEVADAGLTLHERYGMTETCITVAQPLGVARPPRTVGRAVQGARLRVADDGELLVRCSTMFEGYLGQADLTAASFTEGWFATGDLVEVTDGWVEIKGRKKELIITGGYNVHPSEVEEAIASHPGVEEAAVVGVDDPEYGQVVVAYVVRGDHQLSEAALVEHVRPRLNAYQRPRQVRFVDALPRNEMGKVVRGQLG